MFASQPLKQLKTELKADSLSSVLANSAVIEELDGKYKSEDEKWFENDSVILKTEELVFNSFFSFIDEPEKLSDHENGEYFEEDIKPKDEDEHNEELRARRQRSFAV